VLELWTTKNRRSELWRALWTIEAFYFKMFKLSITLDKMYYMNTFI